jgi:hypothetical protein
MNSGKRMKQSNPAKHKISNPWRGEIDLTTGNLFKKMMLFTAPIVLARGHSASL